MSLVKLASKEFEKKHQIAKYTPAGAFMSPLMIGGSLGMIGSAIHPGLSTIGTLGGIAAGVANYRHQKKKGEFKKTTLPGYVGTRTGLGSFGATLLPVVGTGIYEGVKTLRHAKYSKKDNE